MLVVQVIATSLEDSLLAMTTLPTGFSYDRQLRAPDLPPAGDLVKKRRFLAAKLEWERVVV